MASAPLTPQPTPTDTAALLQSVVEASDIGLCVLDCERCILSWNLWLAQTSAVPSVEALGRRIESLFPELVGSRFLSLVDAALRQGMPGLLSQKFHPHVLPLYRSALERRAGQRLHQMISIKPLSLPGTRHCLVQVVDVSPAVLRDQYLREQATRHYRAELRTRAMLSSIAEAVIVIDPAGNIEFSNLAAEQLTGYSDTEAMGRPLDEVYRVYEDLPGRFQPHPQQRYLDLAEIVRTKSLTLFLSHREGLCFPVEQSLAEVRDENGEVQGQILVFRDVSKSRKLTSQLNWQAKHDALTGLFNRAEFDRQLSTLLDEALINDSRHCLLFLDLDRFKVVNDTCGHGAGDELLRQLGTLIKRKVRRDDILARLGGDEFGILLANCPVEVGLRIAETIRREIEDFRFAWGEHTFTLGMSIGLVQIEPDSEGVEHILSLADTACYTAKDAGRNQIHLYQPGASEAAIRHGEVQWVSKIRQALEQDRFCLFAQPIRPSANPYARDQHLEILIRMVGEDNGLIPPGAFIPAAERFDLMPEIDRWVVRQVAQLLSEHKSLFQRQAVRFFINLSGRSLSDQATLKHILQQIEAHQLDGGVLCFEVTETAAISNLSAADYFIHSLQRVGCEFALDDFGSGLSSFGYLKHLPVNYLKIDGSFVKDMVDDPIDQSMVEAINRIGQILGLKTIAEFVENEQILARLQEIGVNYVQGYGIQAPFPLLEWVQKQRS